MMDRSVCLLSEKKMLCNVGEKYVYYSKGNLYICDPTNEKNKHLISLPGSILIKILVKIRAFERFARLEPRLAIELNDKEFLLSYQGQILRINVNGEMFIEHKYRSGMNNPLSFCVCDDRIIYGEYYGNLNHEEVSIYERVNNGNWEKKYTFPAGCIQHIHQICYDEYRRCFWVLTGDKDNECAIWKTDEEFKEMEPIFGGKQKYRSCFIMPSQKGIAYSTDTPLEENSVFYSEECDDGTWKEPQKIYSMPGPCIYGKKLADGKFVMATSVEPDVTLPTVQYYLTNSLGKGVKDRNSHIIYGNVEESFVEIAEFPKDNLKMWLFQFGNILFPNIDESKRLICTGQSLNGIDGKTFEIILSNTGNE